VDLSRVIRKLEGPVLSAIPIIALTANCQEADPEPAYSMTPVLQNC
jgi:hypothetical protein